VDSIGEFQSVAWSAKAYMHFPSDRWCGFEQAKLTDATPGTEEDHHWNKPAWKVPRNKPNLLK
jgi:hypothetical protein